MCVTTINEKRSYELERGQGGVFGRFGVRKYKGEIM